MSRIVYKPVCETSKQKAQWTCRFFVTPEISIRMGTSSANVYSSGPSIRSTHGGQICCSNKLSSQQIQQSVSRPILFRSQCVGTKRLETTQQLHKSTSVPIAKNSGEDKSNWSIGNGDCSGLACVDMAPPVDQQVEISSSENPKGSHDRRKCRAMQESTVESICLANLWRGNLRNKQWDDEHIAQFLLNWAPTTLWSYDSQVRRYIQFCLKEGYLPEMVPCHVIAHFFSDISASLSRPKSIFRMCSAALGCYFEAFKLPSPIDENVRKLIQGLIKSGTLEPMRRTDTMPRQPL